MIVDRHESARRACTATWGTTTDASRGRPIKRCRLPPVRPPTCALAAVVLPIADVFRVVVATIVTADAIVAVVVIGQFACRRRGDGVPVRAHLRCVSESLRGASGLRRTKSKCFLPLNEGAEDQASEGINVGGGAVPYVGIPGRSYVLGAFERGGRTVVGVRRGRMQWARLMGGETV